MAQAWQRSAKCPFATYKREAIPSRGIVASNHPMASAAGLEMLAMPAIPEDEIEGMINRDALGILGVE